MGHFYNYKGSVLEKKEQVYSMNASPSNPEGKIPVIKARIKKKVVDAHLHMKEKMDTDAIKARIKSREDRIKEIEKMPAHLSKEDQDRLTGLRDALRVDKAELKFWSDGVEYLGEGEVIVGDPILHVQLNKDD